MRERDSVFVTHRVPIILPEQATPIFLQPIGDVHETSTNHDKERYQAFLAECRAHDTPHTYYILMGDEHDYASWTERKKMQTAGLHDSTLRNLDQHSLAACKKTVADYEFARGRILGSLQGNHYWQFVEDDEEGGEYFAGQTSTEWICEHLGCKWLGAVAFVRLTVQTQPESSKRLSIDIVAAHGVKAGGKLLGTSINQVEDLKAVFPEADIYLMAHNHQRGALPSAVMVARSAGAGLCIREKRQWFGRTGSFLKGYVAEKSSYIVQRIARAAELGTIVFKIELHRHAEIDEATGTRMDILYADVHCWS